jgi:PAS domain S-box-containing protein
MADDVREKTMNDISRNGRRRVGAPGTPLGPLGDALARAGDGAYAVGADGRIVLWNRAAETMLGYAAREVVGRSCCDVVAAHDDNGNPLCYEGCHVRRLAMTGEPIQNFDMKTRTKTGQAIWLNVSVLAVALTEDAGGSFTTTVHLFRDVTAKKEVLTILRERAAGRASGDAADTAEVLSRRELEVLRLLASGLDTRTSAERLHVSPATIRNHVQNIFAKLKVHSRLQAVAYASRHRLL